MTLFSKILAGQIPGPVLYQDDLCAVIKDIQPQAPHHYLVFPKEEIRSLAEATPAHKHLLGHMLVVAGDFARTQGFSNDGFRLVLNTNDHGGQSVYHIHIHILAGRPMTWPPG
jgi:histidine triad (HIT) family protein